MKKIFILMLAAVMVLSAVSCAKSGPAAAPDSGNITDDILKTFEELAKIPRPSHSEQQISDYLKDWAEGLGFKVVRDEAMNLVIDVPATKGMEGKPVVALQGHMDMVFAQNPGSDLDPLNTEIRIVNDGTRLTSDGNTSIGADDGIGLATIMNIAMGKMAHGPLRLIMTANEEDGMTGVFNLDPECVKGISYLINLDSEEEGKACLSTAAGVKVIFSDTVSSKAPSLDAALKLDITGLNGGHSGLDIDKGRLNAAIAAAELVQCLAGSGIEFELASLTGGTAPNAIPSYSEAVLCVRSADTEKARELILSEAGKLKSGHADSDPGMEVSVTGTDLPEKVIEDAGRALGLVLRLRDGVYTMSADVDGLVESSSNLGVVRIGTERVDASTYIRSSSPEKLAFLTEEQETLGSELGIACTTEKTADPWPYKTDNTLFQKAAEAYRKLYDAELEPQYIHAGIECGTFFVYNNDINMISVGPTLHDPHTTKECLEINTVEKVWKLVEEILKNI